MPAVRISSRHAPRPCRQSVRPAPATAARLAAQVWLVALVLAAATRAASAQVVAAPDAATEAQAVAEALMSPYCPGQTLAACPSPGAATLREELLRRFAQGEERSAVVADLVSRFGSQVTGVPGRRGFGMLAWVLPPAGGAAILLLVWAMTSGRRAVRESDAPVDPAMSARVDEELLQVDA